MTYRALNDLLTAAKAYYQAKAELQTFVQWPSDLKSTHREPVWKPGCAHLQCDFPASSAGGVGTQLIDAIYPAEHMLEWRTTYTQAEVGADYLARSAWFELIGPNGHFHSDQCIAFIAYWGRGLTYPWHKHEAEEIYTIVAGEACLHVEGEADKTAKSGDCRLHLPWQPHALTTPDAPVATFCMWRGSGLNADPVVIANG
ncbi:MAG: dimethylsulfonioproprionate lyase family protein [Pseudomonadota bacterium]